MTHFPSHLAGQPGEPPFTTIVDALREATAKTIDPDGWLHTGDLGVADEHGRICFIDRLKDMHRVGGENVAPADVEGVLNAHPAVKLSKVVGVPDPRLTEVVAAYVVRKDGARVTPRT